MVDIRRLAIYRSYIPDPVFIQPIFSGSAALAWCDPTWTVLTSVWSVIDQLTNAPSYCKPPPERQCAAQPLGCQGLKVDFM